MSEYTLQQKAFVFSMISSAAANMKGTPPQLEQAVTDKFNRITAAFPQFLGEGWQLVWGPVVYEHKPTESPVADNTAFVARGTGDGGKPVYIVSIAGTNPVSMFDIFTEDLSVHQQDSFGRFQGKISNGTNIGVMVIEGLVSGVTLLEFLKGVAGQDATIVFAGHSLGGALAPTVALDYVVHKGLDPKDYAKIYVCPTAGPTPGDSAFALNYSRRFPARDGFNENLVSSLDAVPRAFTDLGGIRTLYAKYKIDSVCINRLTGALEASLLGALIFYGQLPRSEFEATFNEDLKPPVLGDNAAVLFAVQALYQHINGYIVHLTPELFPELALPPLTAETLMSIADGCAKIGKT
jgi:hypothetical protein